jgi:hypothetical protein
MRIGPILSVRQPYAGLIMSAIKWTEVRSYRVKLRGHLWIHASRWNFDEERVEFDDGRSWWRPGCILGRVKVLDCVGGDAMRRYADGQRDEFSPEQLEVMDWHVQRLRGDDEEKFDPFADAALLDDDEMEESPAYNWVFSAPWYLREPIPYKGAAAMWYAELDRDPTETLVPFYNMDGTLTIDQDGGSPQG